MRTFSPNNASGITVGVLALQGDFERHLESLTKAGAKACEVRSSKDFKELDALILPGGESSTMSLLLREFDMWSELKSLARNKPVWGTCAGLILLSSEVDNSAGKRDETFEPLSALDVTVSRNAYGRQIHSFEDEIEICDGENKFKTLVSFIRAPKITRTGASVEVLASAAGLPTLVRQNNLLGSAFHTELHQDTTFTKYFLNQVASGQLSPLKKQNDSTGTIPSREVA